jgi:hypothetical protein
MKVKINNHKSHVIFHLLILWIFYYKIPENRDVAKKTRVGENQNFCTEFFLSIIGFSNGIEF